MDISRMDSNDRTDVALGGLRTTGDQTTQNNILRVCSTMGRPVHNKSTSSTSTGIRDSPHTTQASDCGGWTAFHVDYYVLPTQCSASIWRPVTPTMLRETPSIDPLLRQRLLSTPEIGHGPLSDPQDVTYGHLASPAPRAVDRSPVAWDATDAPFNPNLCLIAVAESGQRLLTLHSAAHKAGSFHPPLSSLL